MAGGILGWKIAEAAKAHLQPDVLYYHKTSQLIGHKMWWGGGIHLLCSFLGAALGCAIICAPFQGRAQKKAKKENQTAHINAYLDEKIPKDSDMTQDDVLLLGEIENDMKTLKSMCDEAIRMVNATNEHYTDEQMESVYNVISDQMDKVARKFRAIDEDKLNGAQQERLKTLKEVLVNVTADILSDDES